MAELADALRSGRSELKLMGVQVPLAALEEKSGALTKGSAFVLLIPLISLRSMSRLCRFIAAHVDNTSYWQPA